MQNTPQTLFYNNNYDQFIANACFAFSALPTVIQHALTDQRRVILVANNPSITEEKLDTLLQPSDILVLFNNFIHADFLTQHHVAKTLPKLLFFRQIGDSLLHFGLPPRSNNVAAVDRMAKQAALGILLSNTPYQFPTLVDDPSPGDDPVTPKRIMTIPQTLREALSSDEHCRILSEQHSVVADYPIFGNIHSSAPTSGFLLYRLLLAARHQVQQLKPDAQPLQIVLLGFNDEDKTAHFWEGHNWAFERQEFATPPNGVDIIRQY